MTSEDRMIDLLVRWGESREQGQELSVENLCADYPELATELAERIKNVEYVHPYIELDDSDDGFLHLPDFSTVSGHADETRLPDCKLSFDEFCQRLIDSGLMDEEQVGQLRQRIAANDARSFAVQLVDEKKLTRFQATVLLDGRDLPLVLDRYVLLGEIGAGGMGVVYKALHQQMDRVVALKILPKEAVDSPDKVKRFQREMKAAARLEHPNIVTAFDATESNGTHFLVMSYVNGSDLAETVRKQGPVSAAKAVSYIAQAASGLEHAHHMGIVHRDIKPGNLLLDKKGKVQILDMGLARIENGDAEYDKTVSQELTQAGMVVGTIAFLAPEQALDSRHADGRSDIYSLGCTLYYLLTGKVLYTEDTMMKTIMAHRAGNIPSLCDERASVPVELDAVFQKMVAKQPEDRFQNMTEVISALEELEIEDKEESQPVVVVSSAMHETATFIDTSRDVIEPQPLQQKGATGSASASTKLKILILTTVAALILLAGIIYRIQTNNGTITVELADESIAVKLTTSGVIIEDGDQKWTINIGDSDKLPTGETYSARLPKDSGLMLTVTDNNGTELDTSKFQIRRSGKILIKVTASATALAAASEESSHVWPKDQPNPAIAPFNAEQAQQHQEEWAKHLGTEVETTNSIGMKFRVIPPGEFLMGTSDEEIKKLPEDTERKSDTWGIERFPTEGPQHRVTLSTPFGMSIHEVTRGQFRQFVDATGYQTDAEKEGTGGSGWKDGKWVLAPEFLWNTDLGFETEQNDDHPVVNVSWNDAVAFCEWLTEKEGITYHLPTEAQWEFSCRAGSLRHYCFGDEKSLLERYAWYTSKGGRNTNPVGQKQSNALGLFDLHGNVWEWCHDGNVLYTAASAVDPLGSVGDSGSLLRGGSFYTISSSVRSARRTLYLLSFRSCNKGFRPLRTYNLSP